MNWYVRKVKKNVARNPVAKALAWKLLVDSIKVYKTRLYMTTPGEDVKETVHDLSTYLTMMLLAAENAEKMEHHELMNAGLLTLVWISDHEFKWDPQFMIRIDDALDAAALTVNMVRPENIRFAQLEIERFRNEERASNPG